MRKNEFIKIYQHIIENKFQNSFCSVVIILLALALEYQLRKVSPQASLISFFTLSMASALLFHPLTTYLLSVSILQFCILKNFSLTIRYPQDFISMLTFLFSFGIIHLIRKQLVVGLMELSHDLAEEKAKRHYFIYNYSEFIRKHTQLIQQGGVFMKNNPPTHEKYQKGLELLIKKTDELDKLSENILKISASCVGKSIPLDLKEKSFSPIFSSFLREIDAEKLKEIDVDSSGSSPAAEWDEVAIKQALNILLNKTKELAPTDKISLSIKEDTKFIKISFSNKNTELEQYQAARLLSPFRDIFAEYHGDAYSALNLSLSKSIIEAHKGSLKVQSNRAEGTTFQIQMPVMVKSDTNSQN